MAEFDGETRKFNYLPLDPPFPRTAFAPFIRRSDGKGKGREQREKFGENEKEIERRYKINKKRLMSILQRSKQSPEVASSPP